MYQVSRVITGFGSGALFSTVPVYQYVGLAFVVLFRSILTIARAEISPPHFRGFLVGQAGVFSALGYSLSVSICPHKRRPSQLTLD